MQLVVVVLLAQGEVSTTPGPLPAPELRASPPAERPLPAQAPPSVEFEAEVPWYKRVRLSGFARVGLFYTFPLQDEASVGGNGGFRLADLRLNVDFRPVNRLTVFASVELAAPLPDPADPIAGRRIVELRDGYVQYDIFPALEVRLGQFRPGYYAEMLQPDALVPFTQRSILANGLAPPDGFGPRQALAVDRQLGLQIGSQRLGNGVFGFSYVAGVFNGAGQNQLFNDNNSVMPVLRIEGDVLRKVRLGLNGYYNVTSTGSRPSRLSTQSLAFGADLVVDHAGFSALAAFLGTSQAYSAGSLQSDLLLGVLGQARYVHELTGLEVGARFAWYEPSTVQVANQAIELTAMLGWRPVRLPLRLVLQYTHRAEEGRGYANDSLDCMLHSVW
jgi:hypothetical protein